MKLYLIFFIFFYSFLCAFNPVKAQLSFSVGSVYLDGAVEKVSVPVMIENDSPITISSFGVAIYTDKSGLEYKQTNFSPTFSETAQKFSYHIPEGNSGEKNLITVFLFEIPPLSTNLFYPGDTLFVLDYDIVEQSGNKWTFNYYYELTPAISDVNEVIYNCEFIPGSIFLKNEGALQSKKSFLWQTSGIRDNDLFVANATILAKIALKKDSISGKPIYVEIHKQKTNENGLLSLEIGNGYHESGSLSSINWSADRVYYTLEISTDGGKNFTIFEENKIWSVPRALDANEINMDVSLADDTLFFGKMNWIIIPNISRANNIDKRRKYECSGIPTEVTKVFSSATGRFWMDRNLGAFRSAQSIDDEYASGDLYQWGRYSDGHQCRNSLLTKVLANNYYPYHDKFILGESWSFENWVSPGIDDLWTGETGKNNPCPPKFRLPTEIEWYFEMQSWNSQDEMGAFSSPLKLSKGGLRNGDNYDNNIGAYWTSTTDVENARILYFNSSKSELSSESRAVGASIRCIQENKTNDNDE